MRRHGPVEAEAVDDASSEAIDLSVRLYHPALAPPGVQAEMRAAGVAMDVLPMHSPPEALSGRVIGGDRALPRESVLLGCDRSVAENHQLAR